MIITTDHTVRKQLSACVSIDCLSALSKAPSSWLNLQSYKGHVNKIKNHPHGHIFHCHLWFLFLKMFNHSMIIFAKEQLTEQVSCCWITDHRPKNDNRLLHRHKMSRGNLCAKNQMFFFFFNLFICALASHWTLNVQLEVNHCIAAAYQTECSTFCLKWTKVQAVQQQKKHKMWMKECSLYFLLEH